MSKLMQQRDTWIPWYFVAFFVFIAAVNAVMVTLAIRTHTGIVTDHPYERGLAYNQVVAAKETQEALGWKGDISYHNGQLYVAMRDKNNRPLILDKATASIRRPTQAGLDFVVELKNIYTPVKFPLPGQWDVRLDVQHDGSHYQQSQRIVVP